MRYLIDDLDTQAFHFLQGHLEIRQFLNSLEDYVPALFNCILYNVPEQLWVINPKDETNQLKEVELLILVKCPKYLYSCEC